MSNKTEILENVNKLVYAYRTGILGGEKMPEDENPNLDKGSKENYMYFTLPMALNYQRNSYVLWECANRMYADELARKFFDSREVCHISEELLRKYLVENKVALQPNKQPLIWKKLCETVEDKLEGDIRNLFSINNYSVKKVKEHIANNKKDFPYLGGNKICNYWLYVLEQYTDIEFGFLQHLRYLLNIHLYLEQNSNFFLHYMIHLLMHPNIQFSKDLLLN